MKDCINEVDSSNEAKGLLISDSRYFWLHRNSFIRVGEGVQFDCDAPYGPCKYADGSNSVTYNYFYSVHDALIFQSEGQITSAYNIFQDTRRRAPKCNNRLAFCHVYNNVVLNWAETPREIHDGHDLEVFNVWLLNKASWINGVQECKRFDSGPYRNQAPYPYTFHTHIGRYIHVGQQQWFSVNETSCNPWHFTTAPFNYVADLRASIPEQTNSTVVCTAQQTCTPAGKWWNYLLPTNRNNPRGCKTLAGSPITSRQSTCLLTPWQDAIRTCDAATQEAAVSDMLQHNAGLDTTDDTTANCKPATQCAPDSLDPNQFSP